VSAKGDVLLVKLKVSGEVEWMRTSGSEGGDFATYIEQLSEGGFIVTGRTRSPGAASDSDAFLLKLSSDGKEQWWKEFGGAEDDSAECVFQAADGGYVVSGVSRSFGKREQQTFVFRMDEKGL
jgi:hypothetical protein